jgi:hypothetical protein
VVLVGSWAICCVLLSSFTMLPVVKQESLPLMYLPIEYADSRQFGGILMLGFGVWYLGFGTRWIAHFSGSDNINRSSDSLKPIITGTQVYYIPDIYLHLDWPDCVNYDSNSNLGYSATEQTRIAIWKSTSRLDNSRYLV